MALLGFLRLKYLASSTMQIFVGSIFVGLVDPPEWLASLRHTVACRLFALSGDFSLFSVAAKASSSPFFPPRFL
jgi:hypothetical protein